MEKYPSAPRPFMSQRRHRREILLFLVAVIVPAVVLVALSLRMIGGQSFPHFDQVKSAKTHRPIVPFRYRV